MGRRPRKAIPFVPTGPVLDRLLKRFGLEVQHRAWELDQRWEETVGPQIASHTAVMEIKYRKLFVIVDSSAWMQQLTFLKNNLLSVINATFDKPMIRDIVFRVGSLPSKPSRSSEPRPYRRSLSEKEQSALSDILRPVADPALAEIVRRVILRDFETRRGE